MSAFTANLNVTSRERTRQHTYLLNSVMRGFNAVILALITVMFAACTTTRIKHVRPEFVSGIGRDSVNRLTATGTITIKTRTEEHTRDPGFVRVVGPILEIRSKILFDTLRISVDSVLSIHCTEDLPIGTVLMATIGGAGAGYALGNIAGESWNSEFPLGLAVIGGGVGGLTSFLTTRETLFLIDPQAPIAAPIPAPVPAPSAPKKRR